MKVKKAFDAAMVRAEHLLTLYHTLKNTRKRDMRSDWSKNFKRFMGWGLTEKISRVDGKGALLILKESSKIDHRQFDHEYLSELLRASVVATISALDRYFHDSVVAPSHRLLRRKDSDVPKALKKLQIPISETMKAVNKMRTSSNSRPGNLIKAAIQEKLHRDYTFQNPNDVQKAVAMLGVKKFWPKVSKKMRESSEAVKERLQGIAIRRNQIVHEADLIRKTKAKKHTLRDISASDVKKDIEWIKSFITAADSVFADI